MKYQIHVDQRRAIALGIQNINQALIFDLLTGLSTWARSEVINGSVYFWVSRQKIADELELLNLKADTVYRHLKALADLGLINFIKSGKKDLVNLTDLGRSYYVGNRSEFSAPDDVQVDDFEPENSDLNPDFAENSEIDPRFDHNSEINPNKLGNKSENNSDLNPTYNTTSNITLPEDQKKTARSKKFEPPTEMEIDDFARENKLNLTGFFEYYASNGWRVGRNPMRDWQMAARGWHKRQQQFGGKKTATRRPGEFSDMPYVNGERVL